MIANVQFQDAIKEVNYIKIENLKVPVIYYNHLIFSKLSSERLKDKADIQELERINKFRKKLKAL